MPKTGNKNTDSNTVPTLAEYITAQIASKRATSLRKSRNRTMPAIPIINGVPNKNSCIYTATDNYGNQYRVPGNWTFYENPGKYGFKPVSLDQAVPGDIIQVFDKGAPYHAMTLDSFDEQGRMKYNYSRGSSGDESDIVKDSINFPNTKKIAYTFVGTQADSTQWTNDYKRLYGNQMKCGGRRKSQLGLDIQYGGRAIPIARNMVYFDGNSHATGGIGVGNNLEVEGGEVGEKKGNTLRIFSAVPFLGGASPAQLVMGGANPNVVFKAQEAFKDRNRIKDDGTRYQTGGQKIYTPSKSIQHQIQETGKITIGGAPTIGGLRNRAYIYGLKQAIKYPTKVSNVIRNIGNKIKQNLVDKSFSYKPDFIPMETWKYATGRVLNQQVAGNKGSAWIRTGKIINDAINNEEKRFGGNMIYEINGNVKNGLMSSRPKAQYGLASKYLKKKNKTIQKPVETKQKEESKILDIRNTAGYKVKQIAENPWVKYPVEVASYLLTGATAKGMKTGAKVASKAANKIDDILGKPRQEYLSRNVSDKTIKVGTIENPIRPKDSSRITKVYKPTINEISQARQATRPKKESKIKSIDKIYKQVIGNKEPRSTVGNVPQWTEISYNPTNRPITAYDASVEFHKRISDILYDNLVKKYGKKNVDKAMKAERISKYKYGGKIKAEGGKFLKYKNGIYTDPETGEEFDVDPEVFKMYGNTKESGVIPTNDYTKGTFDNARPQYYAEKRLPIAGSQSIAEKAGLARSGWSYADNTNINYNNYVSPKKINAKETPRYEGIKLSTIEEDYMTGKRRSANRHPVPDFVGEVNKGKEIVNVKTNSEPRKGRTKVVTSNTTPKSQPTIQDTVNQITRDAIYKSNTPKIDLSKAKMPTFDVSQLGSKETKATRTKLNTSSTGGGKQSNSDGRWIPQFNSITTRDWIGLGSNLAGHIASYFTNNALLSKYPTPVKPVMVQAAKLKTTHNINPELTNNREVELTNRGVVRRNTQSSNTSIAREQRIMNEARGARNVLYGQKENIETNLINQDRVNRQSVYQRNIAAYNDWLDKTMVAKTNKWSAKQQNIMNLVNGISAAVNHVIGTIENRELNNNTIRAIAAANPNVDGRLLGIGDYHTQKTKRW